MELSREQAVVLKDRLTPALGYLSRVRRRMQQCRMDGQLYHDVLRAPKSM